MDRQLLDAYDIAPSVTRKWCVLVQVFERRNPKRKPGGPLYKNYVVTDTKAPLFYRERKYLLVFDKCVEIFAPTLEPFKRYHLSNAVVRETPARFKTLQYPYTYTLKRRNLVEPYHETIPPPLPCTFQFEKFSELYRYADQKRPVCIKALVVHTLSVQECENTSSYRECVVVNEEMIPMLIKVWDDVQFDTDVNVYARYKFPFLIFAYGLKVTTEYNAHVSDITSIINTGAFRDPNRLFHLPRASEILPLEFAVSAIENVKTTWTEGMLAFLPGQRKIWFEACEKCLTPLEVHTTGKIMCSYCKEYTKVIVRFEFGIFLSHGTTVVPSTLKSPEADRLLPYTPNEVRLAAEENKPLTAEIEAALENKHVICFVRYYDKEYRGIMQRCYPILRTYTEAELNEYNAAQQAAALAASVSEDASEEPPSSGHIGTPSSTPNAAVENSILTPTFRRALEEVWL